MNSHISTRCSIRLHCYPLFLLASYKRICIVSINTMMSWQHNKLVQECLNDRPPGCVRRLSPHIGGGTGSGCHGTNKLSSILSSVNMQHWGLRFCDFPQRPIMHHHIVGNQFTSQTQLRGQDYCFQNQYVNVRHFSKHSLCFLAKLESVCKLQGTFQNLFFGKLLELNGACVFKIVFW